MRFRILTQYVLKELALPFFFGLCAFSGILVGVTFINLVSYAEKYSAPFDVVLKILLYQTPEKLALGIPMAMLLATLIALGRLSGQSEIIAMRAGGLSFFRLTLPILIVGLLVSGFHFYLNESVVPTMNLNAEVEKKRASGQNPDILQSNFLRAETKDGKLFRLIHAASFNPARGVMNGVHIHEYDEKGREKRNINAESLVWFDEGWHFTKGEVTTYLDDYKVVPMRFDTGYIPSGIEASPQKMMEFSQKPSDMSFWVLKSYIQTQEIPPEERRKLEVDLYFKLALPFASFIFALLGAPVGLQTQRKSSSAGFGLSFVFIFIYYILMGFGGMMGKSGLVSPFTGAWMQNFLLGGYGIYNFIRVKK
jgi:lipopolysaccharide export system permease protein